MNKKRIFTESEFQDIVSMYNSGEVFKKILKKYEIGHNTLVELLEEKEIQKRSPIKHSPVFICNKTLFESKGYCVVSENVERSNDMITVSDEDGYLYTLKYCNATASLNSGSSFLKFSKYNPNSIFNISVWLKNNKPHLTAQSESFIDTDTKVEFLCSYCNNKFYAIFHSVMQEINNYSCPYCSGHKTSDKNRFSIINPKIIDYWDSTKNSSTKLEEVSFSSSIKYWWKCKNGHSWSASPNDIHKNSNICPFCSGFYTTDKNRFILCYPEIAKQADKELNSNINIHEISNSSSIKLFWKCEFNHIWQASVSNRVRKNQGCPYCSGRRVTDKNRLYLNFPDIYSEIDFEKNDGINFYELGYGTQKKIWWKCNNCNESYFSSICNRTGLNRNCPNCDMSKGEIKIKKYLIKQNIKYTQEFYFKNCKYKRVLPFDFFLEDHKTCIEYQGQQHYFPHVFFGGKESFDIQQIKDKIKVEYCKKNDIKLIVVPYWEYENIENILINNLL